ncbi:MAG: DNA repair protein RecN [Clostridia bacterium]|nr:DNA repair protein RecN [Clostridia bacterium]
MLLSLHIENIAVIKSADIDFAGGFTVLTGETGAGKSIIIDSINLILGGKQSRDLIRSGEESAQVSAIFGELSEVSLRALEALGITPDEDGLLMVQRTITAAGKSNVKVNGRTIPVSMQREAMKYLIGIHGQHDNMTLLVPDNHILYLDEFAGIGAELTEYEKTYDQFCELNRRIAELSRGEREKAQRIEFLRFQIDEIESAKLKPDEEEQLCARRAKLQNSEKITQLSRAVYSSLYQNEKGTAALDKVKRSMKALDALSAVIPAAEELSVRLDAITYELEDIALTAEAFADDSDGDPTAQLDKIETRLDEISRLERKYGDTLPDVLTFLEKAKEELESIELSEEKLAEYTETREYLLPVLAAQADELSERRAAAAEMLEAKIVEELAYLDMRGVSFSAGVKHRVETDGGASYARRGVDDVEFLIATNKGEPLKPLAKIASGGELSRIMLAIKTVLADKDSLETLIFDEVDTGVSGKTSQKIGIKLRDLAAKGSAQVLCVTHSAQIAALADNHYLISKGESGGRVSTSVTPLDTDGRVREVARIMGGINITDKLLETAREMIDEKI